MDQSVAALAEEIRVNIPTAPMRFRRRYSGIGLDLGSSQVKLIQLKQEKQEIGLHQFGVLDLPPGVITAGRIVEPDILTERLSWMVKKLRFRKNKCNLCIGSQAVILRHLQLPKLAPREIPAAMRFEAEKRIMIPLEEAVMDYIVMGERTVEGNELLDLAVVAAPKDVVNDYLGVVMKAGLYPDIIEIESFSLQRVLPFLYPEFAGTGEEALMLLDIGAESSNLVVFDQGGFSFARTLNVGVNRFCRQISDQHQVSFEEARELLYGEEPFVLEGVQEIADELVNQIRRSLQFYLYNVEHDSKEIKTMFICGGGATIVRLPTFLGFELKVEPKLLNPFNFIRANNRFIQRDLERDGHLLNVAAGLALRGWLR